MALAMHQAHMAPEVIGEAVLRENREQCDPPKTEREVIELVNRVLEYHVPPTVTVGANPDGLDEKLQTVEQALANTPKELEWLVENLFPTQSILAIAAMIKTGKTTFILDIVRQLLTGDPWCELPTKKSAVIYLTEQSPMSFNTELQLAGIKGGAMKVLYHLEATRFGWLSIAQKVVEWGQRFEAGLVVVDTLPRWADLTGEGESQAGSARIISALEPVLATGCSLALVFHSGKDGDSRSIENAIRGSSAWGGAVDQIYRLRRPQGNQRDNCRVLESSGRYNHVIAEKLGLRFVDDRYEITSRKEVEKVASGAINRSLDALPKNPENAILFSELLEKSGAGTGTVHRAIKSRSDIVQRILSTPTFFPSEALKSLLSLERMNLSPP
jgi:AAA domain